MSQVMISLVDLLADIRYDHRELIESLTEEEVSDIVVDVALLLVDRYDMVRSIHLYSSYLKTLYPFDEYDYVEMNEFLMLLATSLEGIYTHYNLYTSDGASTDYVPKDFICGVLYLEKPVRGAKIIHSDSLASFRIKQCSRS